jgi:hypothetical protein
MTGGRQSSIQLSGPVAWLANTVIPNSLRYDVDRAPLRLFINAANIFADDPDEEEMNAGEEDDQESQSRESSRTLMERELGEESIESKDR